MLGWIPAICLSLIVQAISAHFQKNADQIELKFDEQSN